MTRDLVIYHGNCTDGLGAAFAFWYKSYSAFEFFEAFYDRAPPSVKEKRVFMVDFCYKPEVMKKLIEEAEEIILLDHHQTALDNPDIRLLEGPKFDMSNCTKEKSGALIAWEYLNPGAEPPLLIKHISDRDLWKFELPGTKEVYHVINSEPHTFEALASLMYDLKYQPSVIYDRGRSLQKLHDKYVASIIETCKRTMVIDYILVPTAMCPPRFASDVGNILCRESIFSATYFDTPTARVFSLRSIDFDVARVAEKYSGGGHRNAAGFSVSRDHVLAKV
jgi:oligoribonuclease NrnB/cAMP/cGMP phosphodiesterase (DHH superfamily)